MTIGRCLEALFASRHDRFEVIVVDDESDDNSPEIISAYPCRLVRLPLHRGAAAARNAGALHSRGPILFFIDADCLVQRDTLARVGQAVHTAGPGSIIGGTYTALPADRDFFSCFQSVFIRYFETKRVQAPDYIAGHAMAIDACTFRKSGGFPEKFLPIIEDVDFSHTLRRQGYRLLMDPGIEVRHIFGFSLVRSLRNAFRKSFYWTIYSLGNCDLFADSGTASRELKLNVASWFMMTGAAAAGLFLDLPSLTLSGLVLAGINLAVNRKLLQAFRKAGGSAFALKALAYYVLAYPVAISAGACGGILAFAAQHAFARQTADSTQQEQA